MPDANRPDSATMRCLECGYALDGLAGCRCPECGRAFDPDDVDTFQPSLEEPERFRAGLLESEASAISAVLLSSGIPTVVEYTAYGVVEPAKGIIWVNRRDLERAEAVLRERQSRMARADQWVCPACGESIEAQFTECWNCQAPRPPHESDLGDGP